MNSKKSLALVSTSALAAGMAQGSVIYSGPLNLQQSSSATLTRQGVDMTGDGINDFAFGFEAVSPPKPYVDARTFVDGALPNQSGIIGVLTKANTGLPVTLAGTMIDASYAATFPPQPIADGRGYMYENGNGDAVVGDWSNTATTDAYVGVELALSGGTRFGWLHFIDDPVSNPLTLTLVDYAYESAPGVGLQAGVIPEPSVGALGALGLAGLLASRRRR
jgi:MYXO-CTERM domain-containing protein